MAVIYRCDICGLGSDDENVEVSFCRVLLEGPEQAGKPPLVGNAFVAASYSAHVCDECEKDLFKHFRKTFQEGRENP